MIPTCSDCGEQHNIGGEAIYCDWEHGKRSLGLSKSEQERIANRFVRHPDGTVECVPSPGQKDTE